MYFECKLCNTIMNNKKYKSHLLLVHNIKSKDEYMLKLGFNNKCKICNNTTSFDGFDKGFKTYCSLSCANKDQDLRLKTQETNMKKYGSKTPAQSPQIKEKMKSIINSRTPSERTKINNKRKDTCLAKYGVEHTSQTDKWKLTNNDLIKTKYEKITGDTLVSFDTDYRKFICKDCNTEYEAHRHLISFRQKHNLVFCTNCNKLNSTDILQNEITNFIKTFNILTDISSRKIISPLELDIFMPSKNIAIEFNGLHWHSEEYVENNYHYNKTEECENLGIQLIHVYEDDWLYKQDIVKSRLKSLLGISDRKIFARKCELKDLDSKTSKEFLDENHIQGGGPNSKYRYGLYFSDELVAVMTFGQSRFEKNKMELHRFANKLNTNVIGGASRLFKHFLNLNISKEIISYADRSWSQGKLYKTLGFKLIGKTKPNYSYIIGKTREDRFKYRKSELVKQGFDKDKTEVSIMNGRKYYRIFDSGSLKFEYK